MCITTVPHMYSEIAFVVTEEEILVDIHGPADGHEFAPRRKWIFLHGSSSVGAGPAQQGRLGRPWPPQFSAK